MSRGFWLRLGGVMLLTMPLLVAASANSLQLIDDAGQSVTIKTPVRRVVTLAPFLTELVFAADGGARLVGVSEYSDYPPAASDLKRVAGAAGIDLETILVLRPDLVLTWRSGNGPVVVKRLRQFGFTVYRSEPRTPQDIVRTLRVLADLFGTQEKTAAVVDRFETAIKMLRTRYSRLSPIKVFYQISERPLMTLNGEHIVSSAIRLCGGRNVFSELRPLAPIIGRESVVDRQPQVILVNSTLPRADQIRQAWLQIGATAAARNGHIYSVDASIVTQPTPRFVDGVQQLCELIDRAR